MSVSSACRGLSHYPVDRQQEDRWRQQTILTHADLYGEGFSQLPIMNNLAGGIVIELLNGIDKHWWIAIVVNQFSDDISVHAV